MPLLLYSCRISVVVPVRFTGLANPREMLPYVTQQHNSSVRGGGHSVAPRLSVISTSDGWITFFSSRHSGAVARRGLSVSVQRRTMPAHCTGAPGRLHKTVDRCFPP